MAYVRSSAVALAVWPRMIRYCTTLAEFVRKDSRTDLQTIKDSFSTCEAGVSDLYKEHVTVN